MDDRWRILIRSLAWIHKISFSGRTSTIPVGVSPRYSGKQNFSFGRASMSSSEGSNSKIGVEYIFSAVKQIWSRIQKQVEKERRALKLPSSNLT